MLTSQATSIATPASRGSRPSRSTRAMSMRRIGGVGVGSSTGGRPVASSGRAPSACSRPDPPSLVALPPIPRVMWRTPSARTASINWPVPCDVRRVRAVVIGSNHRQARPLGQLHDGPCAVRRPEPAGGSRREVEAEDLRLLPLPAAGGRDGLERPFAAVRERAEEDRVVRAGAGPAVGERRGDLDRGQRPLERVGRDEDRQRLVGCGMTHSLISWPSRATRSLRRTDPRSKRGGSSVSERPDRSLQAP